MTPPADPCDYVASSGIPLYVCSHEMLSHIHDSHVCSIDELKGAVHTAQTNI